MFVTFADGTTTSADLVIGADGIHSAVRSHYVVRSPCLESPSPSPEELDIDGFSYS